MVEDQFLPIVGREHLVRAPCKYGLRITDRIQLLRRPVEYGQFRSQKFVRALKRHGLVGSMGRVGAAGDNASMEAFFSLLQNNVPVCKRWATRQEFRIAIVTEIERT